MVSEWGVEEVVVGLPLHMDGTEGASAKESQKLAGELGARLPGVRLVLVDERLSSVRAGEILKERGEKAKGRKGRVDQVAASLLLQEYLDSERP
jgi:putative Holliday junction resolvase